MNLLFLNSLGTGEFILILLVVLMLFGSKGLPDFARNIGRGMREIKDASNEIRRDIQNSALEMRRDLNVPSIDELSKLTDDPLKGTTESKTSKDDSIISTIEKEVNDVLKDDPTLEKNQDKTS